MKMYNTIKNKTMKGIARAFVGEGMFLNHYIAVKDSQEIAFASSLPDSIIAKELNVETLIGQKLLIYLQ